MVAAMKAGVEKRAKDDSAVKNTVDRKREPDQPGLQAQGIGAVGEGDAQRAGCRRHRGRKAQRQPDAQAGKAHADGHGQAVFEMGPEHGQSQRGRG